MNSQLQLIIYTVLQRYITAISKKYDVPKKDLELCMGLLKNVNSISKESKKSNINGKSLEYAICRHINNAYNTSCISQDYDEYKQKYDLLPKNDKDNFDLCGEVVCEFLTKKINSGIPTHTYLNPDSKGKESLTADIVVSYSRDFCVNLSIKNNKFTSKHQRPMAFMDRCGINKNDIVEYRKSVQKINDEFYSNFHHLQHFRSVEKDYIKTMYSDINNTVVGYIKNLDKNQVKNMFHFLNGIDTQLYIVQNTKTYVDIYDCTNKIHVPTRVSTSLNNLGYIILEFNSKHKFSMRLHTASSKITKNLSLKYDTVLINVDEIYKKVRIKKVEKEIKK